MADMDVDLYDALKQGGASEEQARAAAIALSEKVHSLTEESRSFRAEINMARSQIAGDMAFIRWLLTMLIAVTVAVIVNHFVSMPPA